MGTHSSILAWKIPWTVEPEGYSHRVAKELDRTERLSNQKYEVFNPNWLAGNHLEVVWVKAVENVRVRSHSVSNLYRILCMFIKQ